MANYTGVEKHRIEGMDCAQCAHDIEVALRKIDGFEEATVSFATETVAIPTGGKPLAEQVIARVEPSARLKSSEVEAAGSKAGETPISGHIHANREVEGAGDLAPVDHLNIHAGDVRLPGSRKSHSGACPEARARDGHVHRRVVGGGGRVNDSHGRCRMVDVGSPEPTTSPLLPCHAGYSVYST